MGLLNRDQILGADDAAYEDVSVPAWGGMVRVKALTGDERDAFEASHLHRRKIKNQRSGNVRFDVDLNLQGVRARLVALCVVDEDGKRLFSEDDVHALGSKSAVALNAVYEACQRLSGLTDDDVEELAESLGDARSERSTTDSPSLSGEPSPSS